MSNKVIQIKNLVKRYGDLVAVDHFNLDVREGEVLGLLGPNGSGKTTTINCLLSLLKYDRGSIEIFGKPMKPSAYATKAQIGIVSQNVAVFDELTVHDNIDYFCGLYIKDREKRKKMVLEAIDFVGLNDFVKFLPKKLSGGLLRRLNIACGIAHQPKLIILDEPTVAVDPQSRNQILENILELNKKGATIIYTSHYMEEVEQICSRVVIIDKGKNLAEGSKEELKTMIKTGETIKIDILDLSKEHLNRIQNLENVNAATFKNKILEVKFRIGNHNLTNLLNYLGDHQVVYGRVLSELPTLNDVFLEITGKELRD
ncbi:MAG: ABC transporter ATP-binding protein [Lachnospiraceae bacterium]|nr:ABC transporter ATP-binding protein [Lachnospiraceae bacterium]